MHMDVDVDVEVHDGGKLGPREGPSGGSGAEQGQGVDMGRLMNSIEITKVSPHTSAPIFEMRVATRILLIIWHRSETVSDMFSCFVARDVLATTTEFVRDPTDRISTRLHLGRR
jgi:hypothetical protein